MFKFFGRKPDLKAAIVAVNARRTRETQASFERALKSSVLFLASENVPAAWKGTVVLNNEVQIPVLTSEAPDGGTALLCFTDEEEVRRRTGSGSCFGLEFKAVCELVARSGYAGIIINPSGPWAGLPADQLRALADA